MIGSQSFKDCPQCHFDKAVYELIIQTNEEYLFCPLCGYDKSILPTATNEAEKEFQNTNADKGQICEKRGFGAHKIALKNGMWEIDSFPKPYTTDAIETFRRIMRSPDVDGEHCYLTKWNERENKVEFVIGNAGD